MCASPECLLVHLHRLQRLCVLLRQGNGAFTYSCHTHCAGSGQGFADIKMADHQGNRVTMREAVGRWWRAPATTKAEVNNYQPCIWSGPDEKPCCVAPPP